MIPIRRVLMIAALAPALAGCVQDSASYVIDDSRDHSVSVRRAQKWFWDSKLDLTVVVARQPTCIGGLDISGVASDSALILHRAPDEYPEPIFILDVDGAAYAVSTQSCQVQRFEEPPADKGPEIGRFTEADGKFTYVVAGG